MKLFNATKKIAAVGAASVIVANAAFAAGLNNYPNNFVEDGKFVGNVVVGSSATADAAAAEALIADLTADLGGDEKVKITYRKSSTSGKELPAVKSNNQINYGETLVASLENELDDSDSSLLSDEKFKKEDYTQKFVLSTVGGKFVRAYESKVDDMDDQEVGVFFKDGETFAKYEIEFDDSVDLNGDDADDDYIGEKLTILGKEFVVSNIKKDEITLVGGSNKVSLGEGEKSTVTVDEKTYDVEVQSVSDKKVLVVVNGQSKSVDKYDSEEVAGVNIVVTDVVSSSRDSVKGYAEIVVGGQEIKLRSGGSEVEIDEEDVSDVYEGFVVESDITVVGTSTTDKNKIKSISLTYKVDDDTFLKAGDSLEDVLFNAFALNFESVDNDEDKAEFKLDASSEDLDLNLVSSKGYEYDLSELISVSGKNTGFTVKLNGADADDEFFAGTAPTSATGASFTFEEGSDATHKNVKVGTDFVVEEVTHGANFIYKNRVFTLNAAGDGVTANIDGFGLEFSKASEGIRFISGDADEAVVFEVKSYDKGDKELTIERISEDGSDYKVKISNIQDKLDMPGADLVELVNGVVIQEVNLQSELRLENDLQVSLDFAAKPISDTNKAELLFTYHSDFDADEGNEVDESFKVLIGADSDEDMTLEAVAGTYAADISSKSVLENEVVLGWRSSTKLGDNKQDESFDKSENKLDKDSDLRLATSRFGTTVKFDTDDMRSVEIAVPKKQAEAVLSYSTGAVASSTSSAIVDADEVEAKKAELEKEGYKIVGTEDVSAVEVEVTAPMTDAEVTEMSNLIVVGGPAVNAVARTLLGVEEYSMEAAGVVAGEAVAKYFADSNSVLVYGYEAADTAAIVEKLVAGEADFE